MAPSESYSRIDALLTLWQGAGARLTDRRNYEWKIAFGVWGAQLVAMGELLTHITNANRTQLHHMSLFWGYLGTGLILAVLHAWYVIAFVRDRNYRDLTLAVRYEQRVLELLGEDKVICVPDPRIRANRKWWKAKAPLAPSHVFEAGLTAFLAVIGPLAVHAVS